MRGIPASAIHNARKHYYIAVDPSTSNWREYALIEANRLSMTGVLHIMNCNNYEEIQRLMV